MMNVMIRPSGITPLLPHLHHVSSVRSITRKRSITILRRLSPSTSTLPCTSVHRQIPNRTQERTKFTVALTRQVPTSLSQALTSSPTTSSSSLPSPTSTSDESPICLTNAQRQHDSYISTLQAILPTFTLPQDPSLPDCVFIEDTAVAIGNHVVINRMASPSRRPEVDAVRDVLLRLGLTIDDMRGGDEGDGDGVEGGGVEGGAAVCDGGDVLYVGGNRRDLFVGLSTRTNAAGAQFLHDSFAERGVNVVPIPILDLSDGETNGGKGDGSPPFLHLKSIVTHVDDRTLLLPRGRLGDELFRRMDGEGRGYAAVRLPDAAACNVVSVNGVVLAPPTRCEETRRILEREIGEVRGMRIIWEDASEFAKCDGALTCKSILLSL